MSEVRCVKCGHDSKFSDNGTRLCTHTILVANHATDSSCGCKCEFPSDAVEPAPERVWLYFHSAGTAIESQNLQDGGIEFVRADLVDRDAVLEEAAKACDEICNDCGGSYMDDGSVAYDCAAAIRAMKSKKGEAK